MSLTGEEIVGEPRKRRTMSPSSVCSTEELETGSGTADFHTIDMGHESSPSLSGVELQDPGPNLPPSGLTIIIATIPAAIIHGDKPLQMNSADGFSHIIPAGVGLVVPLSLQNSSPAEQSHTPRSPLHVVQIAMVIGFVASFMGILLRHTCPVMASKMEKTGYLSAALGFFLMMSLFLPDKVMWIGWVASAVSLIAFILACLRSHRLGLATAG
ncbi:hypothetical protein AAG906_022298 [Vitis piasezkii]